MGKMNIAILGREYAIACDDGQEAHLGKLSQLVNERVQKLTHEMGRGPESTMLVYTALMIADELLDSKKEIKALHQEIEAMSKTDSGSAAQARLKEMEAAMVDSMNHIAERIEQISSRLEAA